MTASRIDKYISEFPADTQNLLQQMRKVIHKIAPEAIETISYAIPTFKLNGKNLVHFAGYKNHIGFYPTPNGIESFKEELSKYIQAKGSVQFPLDEPLPFVLIERIVQYRLNAMQQKKSG